jgi:hypothetical protein
LDLIKISIGTSHGPNSESLLVIFYKVWNELFYDTISCFYICNVSRRTS